MHIEDVKLISERGKIIYRSYSKENLEVICAPNEENFHAAIILAYNGYVTAAARADALLHCSICDYSWFKNRRSQ